MIAVGIDVLYNAVKSIVFFKAKTPDLTAAIVAIICAVVIYIVYRYNKKLLFK